MPKPQSKPDFADSLAYLNPWTLTRYGWLVGRRGWERLWRAPGPNSRFFIATTFIWSVAMALTDPYKALYLSKLGLSNLAIGGFFALDMGLRVGGVLLGGLFAQRWGHKFTLLLFDALSWGVASLVLALATEPWHIYLATCLTATNALVSGSVTQLLVEDTPQEKRAPTFALFSLSFALPTLLLPLVTGQMIEHWGIIPVMRGLFALTSVMTLGGCWWRSHRMVESKAVTPQAGLQELFKSAAGTLEQLLKKPRFWAVLGLVLLFNSQMNLNKAWSGLFITQSLKMNEALVGQMATAGAVAFVLVSLAWVPRLKPGASARLFFWVCALGALPSLGLVWAGQAWALVLLGFAGGVLGGLQGPLLSEHLADLLPVGREGLAQSLISCVMQVAVALSLALGGAIFETRFNAFPWILASLSLGMGAIAWRLARAPAVA